MFWVSTAGRGSFSRDG